MKHARRDKSRGNHIRRRSGWMCRRAESHSATGSPRIRCYTMPNRAGGIQSAKEEARYAFTIASTHSQRLNAAFHIACQKAHFGFSLEIKYHDNLDSTSTDHNHNIQSQNPSHSPSYMTVSLPPSHHPTHHKPPSPLHTQIPTCTPSQTLTSHPYPVAPNGPTLHRPTSLPRPVPRHAHFCLGWPVPMKHDTARDAVSRRSMCRGADSETLQMAWSC